MSDIRAWHMIGVARSVLCFATETQRRIDAGTLDIRALTPLRGISRELSGLAASLPTCPGREASMARDDLIQFIVTFTTLLDALEERDQHVVAVKQADCDELTVQLFAHLTTTINQTIDMFEDTPNTLIDSFLSLLHRRKA